MHSSHKEDFFSDIKISNTNDLDDFLERIRSLVKHSSENANQASMLAYTILESISTIKGSGFLDFICESLGLWNNSEIFIIEKRLSKNEIVQAGLLPEGASINFRNEYN